MSFISILKKIGTVALGIEHVAAPILSATIPGAAGIFTIVDGFVSRIQSTIQTVEVNNPITAQGQAKAGAVIADFESGLELANAALALDKKVFVYDKVALQTAIDSQVAAFNAFAVLKASVHVVPLPAPAPAVP